MKSAVGKALISPSTGKALAGSPLPALPPSSTRKLAPWRVAMRRACSASRWMSPEYSKHSSVIARPLGPNSASSSVSSCSSSWQFGHHEPPIERIIGCPSKSGSASARSMPSVSEKASCASGKRAATGSGSKPDRSAALGWAVFHVPVLPPIRQVPAKPSALFWPSKRKAK